MAFDPNQPFEVVEEVGFDPNLPFELVEEPIVTSFTQEVQQLGPAFVESLGRPLESMGESFEVLGFQGVADALKGAITEPENYVSAAQRFMEPKEDEAQFLGFAWQYAPRAAVEQAGQAIGSVATRVAGGIAGAPLGPAGVAAGAFVGPAIFEAAQIIGPVAKERAKNNGREVPTNEDILAATVTAAGSGALNAIGAKYLPGGEKATGKFFKRVASSFLGEAATEAPQSIVEQVGTTAGTEAGLNINLKQAIGEGLIGGVTGAGLTGITAPFTKGAEEQVIRTPEQAEEIDIEAKANEEAVSLLGAPADQAKNAQISKVKELEAVIANNEMLEQAFEPNTPEAQRLKMENKVAREEIEKAKVELEKSVGLTPVENTKQVQSRIQQAKVDLTGLEPTSRKAKALEAQIAQDEAKLKALSEPIAAAEAEQARLAREIAVPVEEAAPAEPAAEVAAPTKAISLQEVAQETGVSQEDIERAASNGEIPAVKVGKNWRFTPKAIEEIKAKLVTAPTEEAVTPPVEPTAAVEEAPIEPVAEAPAITPAPVAETPAVSPAAEVAPIQRDMTKPEQMTPEEFEAMRSGIIKRVEESAMPPKSELQKKAEFKVQMLQGELKRARTFEGGNIRGVRRSRGAVKTEFDLQAELDAASAIVAEEKAKWNAERDRKNAILKRQLNDEFPEAIANGLIFEGEIDGKPAILNRVGLPSSGKDIVRNAIRDRKSVSAVAIESYDITLPEGYTKQGDLYVYQPTEAPTPAVPAPTAPEVAPAPEQKELVGKKLFDAMGTLPQKANKARQALPGYTPVFKIGDFYDFVGEDAGLSGSTVVGTGKTARSSLPYYQSSNLQEIANRTGKPIAIIEKTAVSQIIQPTSVTTPPVTEAPTPAAPTPAAPAVGNRVKLGKSPQTYTIEEVIPQSETEKELGEQYYSVRNEKTGEVQTVEAKDIKPVKAKGVRKMAARVKDESLVVPEADRYTFEQAEAEATKLFGGMPEGFIIVNDSVDPEYEFKAGYEPDSGDIILNLAYIRKGESVRNLIAHELGHYAAGDPEIRAKLQEFLDALPPTTRSRIERFVERFYNEDTGDMRLEEKQVRAFAQMLKDSENRGILQKLIDAVKRWLNEKLGTNFQPSDKDVAAVLSGAINRYKSGEKIAREDGGMREAKVTRSQGVQQQVDQAKQIQSVVDETIGKMPQDQARDYNAFVNEGKSEAQIAEENNTSVSQVRTNIVRGKKAVGDAIKKAKIDTKAKPENVVLEWTTGAVKKYFTKEGDLPFGTFQNWVRRNAKLAREAEEARQATQDFYEGLRKLYKINKIKFILDGLSSIPPEDVARFNDALAGEIPINQMPTEIQEPLTRMRQHIDAMSSELIATGQLPEYLEAKAMNNLGVYLTRSYKIFSDPKWINKIPQEKLTAARNFLYQQQSKTDPNFTIEDADRKLEQMLNDWAGEKDMEGKRGGRLGAKDLSVMMTRSEVPKQLRDVMGENTNVIFNYANTIAKISRFVADQQFLDAVKKEGAGKFLFTKDAAPKGFNTLIAPEESRTMAPLSGLRTTPEIAKAFEEFGKAYDAKANPFLYAFGWLNAVGKANLTVGSLFTQARNIIGQPFFFLANGHADLRAINREVERIMKSKGLSKDKARNELVKMAAGEGLVNENAYAGELKEAFEQIGLKTFEDMDADEFSRQFVLLRLFKKGTQGAQKVYQKTDELGKLIGWLNETNRIQKMNPGMSREDAMSIASERTRNTYPTYSQGSEALRLFRRQPFFGPFATFFYETFRTTYWNVVYAFQDINSGTEAGKQEGIKRLAGTMAQIAIGAYLVNAISAMVSGIGDQEEEDVRRMLPPWAANASLVWFPKTKDGVYDFINFSSLNPYNALSDPFVTMMSGFSRGEDPTDIFINAAGTFLSPFTSEQPVTAATVDALRNVTERGTKVYNEEDDLGTKTSKILLHIFGKAFTPGTIDRLRKRIIPAIYGETVGTRAPAPLKEISAEFTGVRFENLDMRQAFQNKAWEFNKAQNDSERIFRDVATRRRRVTEEEQVEAYRRAEESRYQNWQEMYRNYMAVRRAGASKEEAVRLMTDIKISKREASYIARGKYVPYEVSDEVRRRSKLNGNVVPLQEIKAIAKEMPRVLEDVQ